MSKEERYVAPLVHFEYADEPGRFGAVREYDIHTGIDLYCEPDADVRAVEYGIVVAIEDFTGPKAGSPWWHDTQAVLIEGPTGVVCYGEIETRLSVGDHVVAGEVIGQVKTVLRKDKGRPRTMLHLELYCQGTRSTTWWYHGEPQPDNLLDPGCLLQDIQC
jgi:murein DD-endopeptidase MepM/ murein hydrolase activator NlpD